VIESSIIALELVFEHRNYLPSLFLFLPLAAAIKWLVDYYKKRNRSLAVIWVSFVTILLILLGTGTYTRNRVWLSERILWEDAAKKAPGSSRPLHNLAWVYYERIGQYDTALNLYNQALKRQMNNTAQKSLILNNMANIRFRRGDFHKAAELWEAAVIAYPEYAATKYRLALARAKSGQTQKALVLVDEILSKRPNYMDPLILKGTILLKQGQSNEALFYFKKCLNRNPLEKKAIFNIGIAYNLMAQYERAKWFFKILHNRYPEDRLYLLWLIETSLKSDDTPEVDRYIDKLLLLIRIEELNSFMTKLTEVDLMDSLSRELVLRQISKRLSERTEDIRRQSLRRQG
jgi:tetratricopeptide (TPR) repeat protein